MFLHLLLLNYILLWVSSEVFNGLICKLVGQFELVNSGTLICGHNPGKVGSNRRILFNQQRI